MSLPPLKLVATGCRNHEIRGSMSSNGITYARSFMKSTDRLNWNMHARAHARTHTHTKTGSMVRWLLSLSMKDSMSNGSNSTVLIGWLKVLSRHLPGDRIYTLSEFVRALGIHTCKCENENDGKELSCLRLKIRVWRVENELHTL
jgi:hypothetical protein